MFVYNPTKIKRLNMDKKYNNAYIGCKYRVEVADGSSHPKFRLKAFISVAMHLPHMGREHLFGYRVGLTDKGICLSAFIICEVKNTN